MNALTIIVLVFAALVLVRACVLVGRRGRR